MKKIIIILSICILLLAIYFGTSIIIGKSTASNFINTKYNDVTYENLTMKLEQQNQYISENRVSIINNVNDEVIDYFNENKTCSELDSCSMKVIEVSNMSNVIVVNAVYKVIFTSNNNNEFHQTTHYNVDYYLKREGLFQFEIFDIIENNAVRVLASEETDNHNHEHNNTDED